MKICPSCGIDLNQAIIHNVEVDYCPQCLGLWFDKDELRIAKDNKNEYLKWVDIDLWDDIEKFSISKRGKTCPKDRMPLYEVLYGDSGVKVDVCSVCEGIWLDRGEFIEIINYLKEKSDYLIVKNGAKEALRQAWEIFGGPHSFKEEVEDFAIVSTLVIYKFLSQKNFLIPLISNSPII